ncbi:hypothetical protein AQZ49_00010 [Novosphingobium sp. FSW06-99]|nr:hypothetical protein AQZ49_00010 [Novosphingobium sp. FSW06-99]
MEQETVSPLPLRMVLLWPLALTVVLENSVTNSMLMNFLIFAMPSDRIPILHFYLKEIFSI